MDDDAGASLGYGVFLRGLISNPKGVSAPTPSSPVLAQAIAAELDLSRPGLVLELGPGTGAVTAALLMRAGERTESDHGAADTALRGRQAENAVPLGPKAVGPHPGDHGGGLAGDPALQLPLRDDPERSAIGGGGAQQHLLRHAESIADAPSR